MYGSKCLQQQIAPVLHKARHNCAQISCECHNTCTLYI